MIMQNVRNDAQTSHCYVICSCGMFSITFVKFKVINVLDFSSVRIEKKWLTAFSTTELFDNDVVRKLKQILLAKNQQVSFFATDKVGRRFIELFCVYNLRYTSYIICYEKIVTF